MPDPTPPAGSCPGCGYDLRALASPRCPECGLSVDLAKQASAIPWAHRRQIGTPRALVRTVRLVLRTPAALTADVRLPSRADALAFRRAITAATAVPLIVAVAVICLTNEPAALAHPLTFGVEWITGFAAAAGLWFFVLTVAGVASYWFHPARLPVEQQERAVTLSYYASAPCILVPVILAATAFALWLSIHDAQLLSTFPRQWIVPITFATWLAAGALVLATLIAMFRATGVLLARTTHCGPARVVCCLGLLPFAWLLLACTFLGLLPGACFYVGLMWASFH